MQNQSNNNAKIYAIIGTLVFHVLVFALFLFVVFKTPLPPFPDTGPPGMEVNFGTSDDGMGDVQPENYTGENAQSDENNSEPENNPNVDEEALITQETEDAPEVKKVEPKEKKEVKVAVVKPVETKKEEPKKEPERTANSNAMYKGKTKSNGGSGGEGETNKPGDQGKLYGSRDVKNHGEGTGTGNTPGNGGNGSSGNGSGISFSLAGRKKVQLPVPKSSFQEEGKVVVEITVDREGKVTNAKPGVKGSTTTDPQLMAIAKKAALEAKFNKDPEAAELQKGQIIYNFILK